MIKKYIFSVLAVASFVSFVAYATAQTSNSNLPTKEDKIIKKTSQEFWTPEVSSVNTSNNSLEKRTQTSGVVTPILLPKPRTKVTITNTASPQIQESQNPVTTPVQFSDTQPEQGYESNKYNSVESEQESITEEDDD